MSELHVFDSIPSGAQLWVLPLSEDLSEGQSTEVSTTLLKFAEEWKSHGAEVFSSCEIISNRFIVITAYTQGGGLSGCSFDSLTKAVEKSLEVGNLTKADPLSVFYEKDDGIHCVSRAEFVASYKKGELSDDTIVFDTAISSIDGYREVGLRKAIKDSWHSTLVK